MKILISESSNCSQDSTALRKFKSNPSFVLMTPAYEDLESAELLRRINVEFGPQAAKFRFGSSRLESVYPYLVNDDGSVNENGRGSKIGGFFIKKGNSLDTIMFYLKKEPGLEFEVHFDNSEHFKPQL